jgi:cell division topological specificity factor
MNILEYFMQRRRRIPTAKTAMDRLQIVLAHERISRDGEDFLPRLQSEILTVVARYVDVDPDKAIVRLDKGSDYSTLEIEIELPNGVHAAVAQ